MNQEKFLNLQSQMRHNNEEYKNFLDDIESWSNELKSKEKEIMKSSDSKKSLPEIRNSTKKKPKLKQSRIKAYDYQSWEKFDVDKALADCDDKEELYSIQNEKLKHSVELKEIGNDLFKTGDYFMAIDKYSEALSFDPSNDVIFTNRAMAYIKVGNYIGGEADCSHAIAINNKSVKAFYRRAKCKVFLNKKEEAVVDYKLVLNLEPDNKLALKEMKELENELNIRGIVEPLYEPLKNRISTKPLKRIEIVDVNPNKSFEQVMENIQSSSDNVENKTDHPIERNAESKEIPFSADIKIYFRVPKTSIQLTKDLSNYRANSNNLAKYVTRINYANYSKLIGEQLDSDLLLDLINGLSWGVKLDLITHDKFVESFNHLSKVSRFSFLWSMISNEEKVNFNDVISILDVNLRNKLMLDF